MWPNRLFLLLLLFTPLANAQITGVWRFAVSGDSRNCGDVVMPTLAQHVQADNAFFYWHLGDFRAIYMVDQDYAQTHPGTTMPDYLAGAWNDFINSQLLYFGNTPVFLALGNHENIPPKDHTQVLNQFADWLNSPLIREQRMKDGNPDPAVKGYYHWLVSGVDFITLDNSLNTFDADQLAWLQDLLARDAKDFSIRALVVGMHEALPDSISADHSMNQSPDGITTGHTVSNWLTDFKFRTHKPVYALASHSHYYMKGIYNTKEWLGYPAALPGWIIGTAGAVRYQLPLDHGNAAEAKTAVYGYLLATVDVSKDDPIQFEFHELSEDDVPQDTLNQYTAAVVHNCWVNNVQ